MGDISWDGFVSKLSGSEDLQNAWNKFSGDGVSIGFRDNFEEALELMVFDDVLYAIHELVNSTETPKIQGHLLDLDSFGRLDTFLGVDEFNPRNFFIRDGWDGMKDVALLHYARNILLDEAIEFDQIVSSGDYFKIPDYKNAFHKREDGENDNNIKWMDRSSKYEYIVKETDSGFEIVTDPELYGTYNYGNAENGLSHIPLDVDTWEVFGNLPEYSADMNSRQSILIDLVPEALGVPSIVEGSQLEVALSNFDFEYSPLREMGEQADEFRIDVNLSYRVLTNGGDDIIYSGPLDDFIDGGIGSDTVAYFYSESGIAANLSESVAYTGYGSDDDKLEILLNIENLNGSSDADIFVGSDVGNMLRGLGGNDHLIGLDGDDELRGGIGDDILNGGRGNDALVGGNGTDTAVYSGNANLYTVKRIDENTISVISSNIDELGTDTLTSIESIQFADARLRTADLPIEVSSTSLINGLGGDAGFGTEFLARNDDSSSSAIDITDVFGADGLNFYGRTFTELWVNNNGSVTFNGPRRTFTPNPITEDSNNPEITPFFADVDTRGGEATPTLGGTSQGTNLVYWHKDFGPEGNRFIVTWDDVGYYSSHTDKLNAFQLVLTDKDNGNFDIEFRYEDINWTTGDASDGVDGLGGTVARAGFTAGTGAENAFFELPASGNQSAILNLEERGPLSFSVRSGDIATGEIPELPDLTLAGWSVGDPHLSTLDGIGYDFHAAGEFILLRSTTDRAFEAQARFTPVGDNATITKAVAFNFGSDTVMFDANDASPMMIAGVATSLENLGTVAVGDDQIFRTGNVYTIVLAGADGDIGDGDSQIKVTVLEDRVDVNFLLDNSYVGNFEGLLGDGDGDGSNDIARVDGTVLDRPLEFNELYGGYRDDWRVADEAQSLFTYDNGETLSGFYLPDHPGQIVTIDTLTDEQREEAERLAEDAGLTRGTPSFNNAVLDYAMTQDVSFFQSALSVEGVSEENSVPIVDDTDDLNVAPTGVVLSASSIAENSADGTVVGDLSAIDPNAGDTAAFELVDDADGRFVIDGNMLTVAEGADLNFEAAISHDIVVKATDSGGLSTEKTLTISVTDVNEAPDTTPVLDNDTIAENSIGGTTVGMLSASDPDMGDQLTFSLTDDAGGRFEIDGAVLKIVQDAVIDFESTPILNVKVRAADSAGQMAEGPVSINVTDVNEAPSALMLSASFVAENSTGGTVVGDLSANDPDADDTLSYALTDDADGRFVIDGATLKVAEGATLDFENAASYEIAVQATDDGGLSTDQTFTISLTDVNEAPFIDVGEMDIYENSPAGSYVGYLNINSPGGKEVTSEFIDDAEGRFKLNDGRVEVAEGADLDFEAASIHSLTLRTTDSSGLTSENTFDVPVLDMPEPSLNNYVVAENSAAGSVVGVLSGNFAGGPVTYALQDSSDNPFEIVGSELRIAAGMTLDYEERFEYAVTVEGAAFAPGDADGDILTGTETFTISVLDVNEAPAALVLSASFVAENSTGGTVVGDLSANDPDADDTLSYALTDDADGRFVIDGATLKVAEGATLDFEKAASYEIAVQATDDGRLSTDQTFTISLTDVNEAPTNISVVGTAALVDENSAPKTLVGELVIDDPDADDSHTFRLVSQSVAGMFLIDENRIVVAPGAHVDFEAAESVDLIIEATDSGNARVEKAVTVFVADLPENYVGTDGDDVILVDATKNEVTTGSGRDTVYGWASEFGSDTVTDFSEKDLIHIVATEFDRSAISFSDDVATVTIDESSSLTLKGDFNNGDFMVVPQGGDTYLTFVPFLPYPIVPFAQYLRDGHRVAEEQVNGIANQRFLTGDDGEDHFEITLQEMGYAKMDNSLGVYEVDPDGNIVDVQVLFDNTNADKGTSVELSDIGAGNQLGFFVVQDGADWAEALADTDVLTFVNSLGDAATLEDGADLLLAVNGGVTDEIVFHSFAQEMNADGVQHALSGTEKGDKGLFVGFEDMTDGGDSDYEDIVFEITRTDEFIFAA